MAIGKKNPNPERHLHSMFVKACICIWRGKKKKVYRGVILDSYEYLRKVELSATKAHIQCILLHYGDGKTKEQANIELR